MYQKLIMLGNLTRDPESRVTDEGKTMCNFTMAVNYFSGREKKVMWVRVLTTERTAELCMEYLKKGRTVLVDGRIMVDEETGNPKIFTKKDGSVGSSLEVFAREVTFVGSPQEPSESTKKAPVKGVVVSEDEYPIF